MSRLRAAGVVLSLVVVALAIAPAAGGYHFYGEGWRHQHYRYPPVPSGYNGIVSVFGQPCNGAVNDNTTNWVATDDRRSYPVHYHFKLGGWGTHYGGWGRYDMSSNVNQDVRGHIRNDHITGHVKRGIYGYNCRRIANSSKWSTHAWGIAVDVNSAYEHTNHYHCHSVTSAVANTWQAHGWKHGLSFGDCMHFQYAVNY